MPVNNSSGPLKLDSCKKAAVRAWRWVAPSQQKTEDNSSRPKTALVSHAWKLAGVGELFPCQTSKNSALNRVWQTSKLGLLAVSMAVVPVVDVLAQQLPVLREDHVLVKGTFEKGIESDFSKELCCSYSATTVRSPVRGGEQALKFRLNQSDPEVSDSRRSELKLPAVPATAERIYRFSILLPANYATDPSMEILAQWHQAPESGEDSKSPVLYLKTDNGRWILSRRWDSNEVTRGNDPSGGGTEDIDLGTYQRGRWNDWVFKVRWSSDSNGRLEVYRNGKLVVRKAGPNSHNDALGPASKIGIYKPDWKYRPQESKTRQREVYFDRVRVEWF